MAVTMEDVAARAGVSRSLVSLVMRNSPRVSRARRDAVLRAAEELGYRRNAQAAQLASRRAMLIGLVLNEPQNQIYTRMLRYADEQAEHTGFGLLLGVNTVGSTFEHEAVDRLLGHRVDGIILVGTSLGAEEIAAVTAQVPVVVAGRRVRGVDVVSVDDEAGARLAVEHLIALGHRDIAHLGGGARPGAHIRQQSYRTTMQLHGLEEHTRVEPGDNTEPGGRRAADRLMRSDRRPTAIFASNDLAALGVLGVAKNLGVSVPDDLSVVGFDNTAITESAYVDLTTIHHDPELGSTAVDLLVSRIDEPRRAVELRLFKPELVVRGTTAPPRPGVA